jgi:hypothetical protein
MAETAWNFDVMQGDESASHEGLSLSPKRPILSHRSVGYGDAAVSTQRFHDR